MAKEVKNRRNYQDLGQNGNDGEKRRAPSFEDRSGLERGDDSEERVSDSSLGNGHRVVGDARDSGRDLGHTWPRR